MVPHSLLLSICLAAPALAADVQFADPFGSHMVLQREATVPVWGTSDPGAEITLKASWSEAPVSCQADADGRWRTMLETPGAGGPHILQAISGAATATLEDVLTGEVWLCSGQSNMEWNMAWIPQGVEAAKLADHPSIRLFTVPRRTSVAPVETIGAEWQACTPETVLPFSATAYFFARELHRAMPDVPLGLVNSSWGGTVAEAWTSEEGLRPLQSFDETLDKVAALRSEGRDRTIEQLQTAWWGALAKVEPGLVERWYLPKPGDEGWEEAILPGTFESFGWPAYDGSAWFRRSFELPPDWKGQDLTVTLGAIDDLDITWVNGQEIGAVREPGRWQEVRQYEIPASLLQDGVNTIAVLAVDTGGGGNIGWSAQGPVQMRLEREGDPQSLELGGTWSVRRGAALPKLGGPLPTSGWFHENSPTALSNGMIAPLVPMGIRGAIWYQGESNRERALQYRDLFPALIRDWRRRFGQGDFPFYWVQIAPFGYGGDRGQAAELREAQTRTLSLPNTGQAVTMDIGNPGDIHPQEKAEVGRRLALIALARDYGMDVAYQGPAYRGVRFEEGKAILSFDHAEGLELRGEDPSRWFRIAGKDQRFVAASAQVAGNEVVVWSDEVADPRSVRFAWGAADASNLFNAAGLPASSFRTDPWPAVSRGR